MITLSTILLSNRDTTSTLFEISGKKKHDSYMFFFCFFAFQILSIRHICSQENGDVGVHRFRMLGTNSFLRSHCYRWSSSDRLAEIEDPAGIFLSLELLREPFSLRYTYQTVPKGYLLTTVEALPKATLESRMSTEANWKDSVDQYASSAEDVRYGESILR